MNDGCRHLACFAKASALDTILIKFFVRDESGLRTEGTATVEAPKFDRSMARVLHFRTSNQNSAIYRFGGICFTFRHGQSGARRPERRCAHDLHAAVGDLPAVCRCRLYVSPRVLPELGPCPRAPPISEVIRGRETSTSMILMAKTRPLKQQPGPLVCSGPAWWIIRARRKPQE